MGITFGDRFVQIGNFRLGEADGGHFSVAHAGTGKTLRVWNKAGNHFNSPRDDYTTLGRPMAGCQAGARDTPCAFFFRLSRQDLVNLVTACSRKH